MSQITNLSVGIKKLLRSSGFKRYFANTSWLLGEKVISLFVSFVVGALVARYLGPDDFGLYNYVQSFTSLVLILAALGIKELLVRNLVQEPENRETILGTAFVLKLLGGLVSLGLVGLLLAVISHDPLTNLLILIVAFGGLFRPFTVINSYFQSKVQARYVVQVSFTQFVISSVVKLLLIFFQAPLVLFVCVVLLNDIILASGIAFMYQRKVGNIFKWKFNKKYAFGLLKDSWPIIFSGFVVIVYMKIDQVMIKHMMDNEAVGIYAVAVKLSEIWNFIPGIIVSSLFPAIINAKKESEEKFHNRLQKLFDFMVWFALAITIFITFTGPWLIVLIYGQEYQLAGSVLVVHIWSSIFVFLGVASSKWLLANNLQKIGLYRTITGAVVNIGLNFVLIPAYGVIGAAVATLFSQAVASYLGYLISKKTRVVFRMQSRSLFLISLIKAIRTGNFNFKV